MTRHANTGEGGAHGGPAGSRAGVTNTLLELFARQTSRKQYLESVVEAIRGWSGCRCVGIRVVDRRDNIPYAAYIGFSLEFWELENWLNLQATNCACIRVVRRCPEPQDLPVMTPRGSFCCNDAPEFVRQLSPDNQARFRGACIRHGFATVAVIPISHQEQVLGAIHLADERPGMAPAATVRFIESMTPLIGEAINRFNAEKSLREQAALLDLASEAIVVRDDNDCITFWSAGAEETYGWTKAEALGQQCRELLRSEFPQPLAELTQDLLRTGQWRGQIVQTRRDGRRIVVSAHWALQQDGDGQPLGVLEIHRDITERQQAEQELSRYRQQLEEMVEERTARLRQANEQLQSEIAERRRAEAELKQAKETAEQASQAKDRFLATLSHELRTPLTPVLATVSALEIDPSLPPATRSDLAMIRRNVELEARLIDDMLDLTRIARGKLELRPQITDVHALLEDAVTTCRSGPASTKPLRIVTELMAAAHHVCADGGRLQQVFWNLINNAIKFTPEGTITIRTSNAEPEEKKGVRTLLPERPEGCFAQKGPDPFFLPADSANSSLNPEPQTLNPPSQPALVVSVEDTGIGIEPHVLPTLFNAFQQGDRSVTRQFGGLGLGLAISKTIIDLHGGTLTAHSDGPRRGATFTVRLPATTPGPGAACTLRPAAAREPAHQPDAASALEHPKLAILLVEDHRDTARTMSRLLQADGHAVRTAHDVGSALATLEQERGRFDVMISDLGLPDGSGLDLMRQLRERYGLPGIALSGYGMEQDVEESKAAGFAEHLTKPVNLVQLEAAIARVAKTRAAAKARDPQAGQ